MSGEEGAKKGNLLQRVFLLGSSRKDISQRNETNIVDPGFEVDAMSIEGAHDDPKLEALVYKHRFLSFDELRKTLEGGGYDMSMPGRNDRFDENRAGVAVIKNGVRVGSLSIDAGADLTQGPIVGTHRPEINKPKV